MGLKDIRDYKYGEVVALLREDGRDVKLMIDRSGKRLEKTITLRRLI